MSRALWLALVSTAALGLAAGCSSGSKCKKACDKMEKCALGDAGAGETKGSSSFTCPFSASCDAKEDCQAKCYLDADCPALLSGAGAALTPCLQQCATITVDGSTGDKGPKSDGPIKLDKGGPCTPQCGGRVCGPDGCGGNCGGCTPPTFCNAYGQCIDNCTINCAGRQCGGDGCGGSCGSCAPPTVCNTQGKCSCNPNCAGKFCGDDGCGGSCGSCTAPLVCDPTGQCVTTCNPACSGKQCGDDGCGGSCGSCTAPASCSNGVCGNKTTATGQICTNQNLCKQPADTCLFMATGAVKGICLTNCNKIGDPCAAPNPGTQFAACALSDATGHNYCGFFCEISGTSYACPNSFDFDCKALDPTAPSIKLCVPKP